MNVYLKLLGKDLKLMKGWMLGGIALLIALGALIGWLSMNNEAGVFSTAMSVLLFGHLFYIPVYIWISLSREWKETSALWLQLPRSGWGLLAVKLASAVIGFIMSYVVTYIIFYAITLIEGVPVTDVPVTNALFDLAYYVNLIKGSFFDIGLLVLYMSISLGIWVLLFNVSVQAVKGVLHRFSWISMFIVFALVFWGYVYLSETAFYAGLTDWGIIGGNGVWTHLELRIGDFLFDLPIMAVFFYVAGWLLDRKVEV